jgi:hypothetical protein
VTGRAGPVAWRVEFYYEASLAGGLDGLTLEAAEILEARLFTPDDLPQEMPRCIGNWPSPRISPLLGVELTIA